MQRIESYDFLKAVIDTISEHVVVIESEGDILFVNRAWRLFAQNNACMIGQTWNGVNYLDECDKATNMGDDFGIQAGRGIRSVIEGEEESFYYEYPCHSPDEKRWFMMRVTPFSVQKENYFIISHLDISERKLAEKANIERARIDGLTDIPNRRYFDESLDNEWRRCRRLGMPISLAIIDLDHFKLLNDTYGHQFGDECLMSVGRILKGYGKRPSDICARYGGEEFAIVFGDTKLHQAKILTENILDEIRSLNIPNKNSPTHPTLTASIGLATMYPNADNSDSDLIRVSDESLYSAKENGRNQISINELAKA